MGRRPSTGSASSPVSPGRGLPLPSLDNPWGQRSRLPPAARTSEKAHSSGGTHSSGTHGSTPESPPRNQTPRRRLLSLPLSCATLRVDGSEAVAPQPPGTLSVLSPGTAPSWLHSSVRSSEAFATVAIGRNPDSPPDTGDPIPLQNPLPSLPIAISGAIADAHP